MRSATILMTLAVAAASAACGPSARHANSPSIDVQSAQLDTLERLLAVTPETDASRPDLDFRLADTLDRRARALPAGADRDAARARAIVIFRAIAESPRWAHYARLDEVLFWYANALGSEDPAAAVAIYRRLVDDYPASKLAADARLALADTQLDARDPAGALASYREVHFADGDDRALYVRYRVAWCYEQLGDHQTALAELVAVARGDHAADHERTPAREKLASTARADAVRAFAALAPAGPIDGARIAFAEAADGDAEIRTAMFDDLAQMYCVGGALAPCIAALRELPAAPNCPWFDAGVAAIGDPERVTPDLALEDQLGEHGAERLADRLVAATEGAAQASPVCRDRVAAVVGAVATHWHHDGKERHDDAVLYAAAAALYTAFLERFPGSRDAGAILYFAADLDYQRGKWCAAARRFARAAVIDPPIAQQGEAAYANVLATRACESLPERGPAEVAGDEPAPIPPSWQHLVGAIALYVAHVASPDPAVQFARGRIFYSFAHLANAADDFRAVVRTHGAEPLMIEAAAALLLDADLRAKSTRFDEDRKIVCTLPAAERTALPLCDSH